MVILDSLSTKIVVLVKSNGLRRQTIGFQMQKPSSGLQWI